jgi:hypothetical protein
VTSEPGPGSAPQGGRRRRHARSTSPERAANYPHIAEWYGHRVFPTVSNSPAALSDQQAGRCPFLSQASGHDRPCVKPANSQGVCTVSATSNRRRQDWLVCPHRALDDELLGAMVRRLFGIPRQEPVALTPVVNLSEPERRTQVLQALAQPAAPRHFVYFRNILGGEVALPATPASPELSFDITVVELLPATRSTPAPAQTAPSEVSVGIGKYGVIELQTMDFHGSYKHAVEALRAALNLFPNERFAEEVAKNPEWARRKMEGPNIANVFKRTFYQVAFKFQVTKHESSVGCLLALPQPVWDSWQPFLGAPELREQGDGTWRLLDDRSPDPTDWICVFDISEQPGEDGGPADVNLRLMIGTDAATLSRAALEVAPAKAVAYGGTEDAIMAAVTRKLRAYLPGLS